MKVVAVPFIAIILLSTQAFAQIDCNQGMEPIDPGADSRMSAPDFIKRVAARESGFAKAFANFGYTVDIKIQTLTQDAIDGEFNRRTTVGFDPAGVRTATSEAASTDTLKRPKLSDKDIDTFVNAPPFALTADVLADKDAVYSGRQRMGDHNTSVFDMLPRNDQAPLRGFIGRTWVWTGQESVLKTCGRSSAFPLGPLRYEVQRTQVANENWFPALIRADEETPIGDANVRVRVTVTYYNYKAR